MAPPAQRRPWSHPSISFFPGTYEFQQPSCVPLDSKEWRLPKVNMTCSLQVFANGWTRAPVSSGYQGSRQGESTRQICQSLALEGNCNWTALWRPAKRLQQQQMTRARYVIKKRMVIVFSAEEGLLAWWHSRSVQLAEQATAITQETDPTRQDNC